MKKVELIQPSGVDYQCEATRRLRVCVKWEGAVYISPPPRPYLTPYLSHTYSPHTLTQDLTEHTHTHTKGGKGQQGKGVGGCVKCWEDEGKNYIYT